MENTDEDGGFKKVEDEQEEERMMGLLNAMVDHGIQDIVKHEEGKPKKFMLVVNHNV